jgi:aryl-alcohol dehydrogenase-like predicted oxidoreductase
LVLFDKESESGELNMIVNKLGNTDIQLSAIGFGAWATGGGGYKFGWGPQEDKDSIATIRRAVELGVNWIDTAPVYGDGHSEEVVAEALKGIKENVFISTKCGLRMAENKEEIRSILKRESIRAEVELSLKRLNRDVIDLYQVHFPAPEEDIEEAWRTLADLVNEGKIRYAGVSNFTLEQLKRIHPIHPVVFLQPSYSMLDITVEEGLLDYCAANHIGIVVYSPMYRGLLTGKFTRERAENLPPDDNRLTLDNYKEPLLSANLQLVEQLRPIAERNKKTLAQLAIAWVLRRPEITSAIVGARTPAQIEQTVPAGDWVLSAENIKELDKILSDYRISLKTIHK